MTVGTAKKRKAKPTVRVINDGVEMVAIGALKLHPRNANQGDVGAIHESIVHNGFWGTVVAQRSSGHVLAGNHRLIAAQQAGASELPVAWVDVDDEAALRILLADNRTTRLGQDDSQALADLLKELAATPDALSGTGFDGDDLDELLAGLGAERTSLDQSGELANDRYAILLTCESEAQQQEWLSRLAEEGLECRALIS